MYRSILVATDGSPGALGALRLARALQIRDGSRVELIGVVEPIPMFDPGMMVTVPDGAIAASREEALRLASEAQIREAGGSDWALRIESGGAAPTITRRAEELGCDLLVVGLGRHRPVDRLLGTETALQVVRMSPCPVLAVPATEVRLPRVAVAAVDFSEASRRAVEEAASILAVPGELHLVHASAGVQYLREGPDQWERDYLEEVDRRLERFAAAIQPPDGISVHVRRGEGEPARVLLEQLEEHGAELIAAGSHGHSFVSRILLGSVSTRLLRNSVIPVLIAPPGGVAASGEVSEGAPHPWEAMLQRISREHAGRRVSIQVLDPELGAQVSGEGYPLRGVDFEARSGTVHIMLGSEQAGDGHLTHSLHGPVRIEAAPGGEQVAEVLRIDLPRGEVLMTIHRE